MSHEPGPSDAGSRPPRRCVVLLARDAVPPAPLLRGLARRGLDAELHHDPPAVLVSLRMPGAAAVVLVDPGTIPRADELLGAVRAYFPRVACWSYFGPTDGAGPRIQQACPGSAVDPRPVEPPTKTTVEAGSRSEPPPRAPGGEDAKRSSRPNGAVEEPRVWTRPASIDELAVRARGPEAIQPAVVTEQELAMLLGPSGP